MLEVAEFKRKERFQDNSQDSDRVHTLRMEENPNHQLLGGQAYLKPQKLTIPFHIKRKKMISNGSSNCRKHNSI